nr:MAG TPA: hypothetical protein [Caudoviricetes sp.]
MGFNFIQRCNRVDNQAIHKDIMASRVVCVFGLLVRKLLSDTAR